MIFLRRPQYKLFRPTPPPNYNAVSQSGIKLLLGPTTLEHVLTRTESPESTESAFWAEGWKVPAFPACYCHELMHQRNPEDDCSIAEHSTKVQVG